MTMTDEPDNPITRFRPWLRSTVNVEDFMERELNEDSEDSEEEI